MLPTEDEVAFKLLHTADWHLGHRFRMFDREDQHRLTRARLDTVDRILAKARSFGVDALICAGDLFDTPTPTEQWWQGLLESLQRTDPKCPVILLPGNHDALTDESVYHPAHPFRQQLPSRVHVVDQDDFTYEVEDKAVIHAVPCRSRAGAGDPTEKLPPRPEGDERIRIGLVHGATMDVAGFEQSFPIDVTNARRKGYDYLALGDTHGFRIVQDEPPAVYPGAPEQLQFSEQDAGQVALVFFYRSRRPPLIEPKRIGYWHWRDECCESLPDLRRLLEDPDLEETVLRLHLDMELSLSELEEMEALVAELQGSDARHGRAGILLLERSGLRQSQEISLEDFGDDLPEVLQVTIEKLQAQIEDGAEREQAKRALLHLYKLVSERRQA